MTPTATPRAARVARAGLASAVAALVALAAHLAGGGAAPAPILLVGLVALLWPAAILLVGAQPRLWRQAAVVALVQGALHGAFAALPAAGTASVAGSGSGSGMAGMHDAAPLLLTTAPMAAHDGGMWGWHCAAWLATTATWRWGERALRALLDRLPLVARLALAVCAPPPAAVRCTAPRITAPTLAPVLLDGRPRRGPPQPA